MFSLKVVLYLDAVFVSSYRLTHPTRPDMPRILHLALGVSDFVCTLSCLFVSFPLLSLLLAGPVATQRRNYRVFMSGSDEPSGMTAERVQSLEAIGFQWTVSCIESIAILGHQGCGSHTIISHNRKYRQLIRDTNHGKLDTRNFKHLS